MAYHPSWVIQYQSHSCRRTVVILFNQLLGYNGAHTFSKSISPKVNATARLGFELAYCDVTEQQLSHYVLYFTLQGKENKDYGGVVILHSLSFGGARGVIVIVVGNGHGDTSSNPGRD